jgi:hypothetical protein
LPQKQEIHESNDDLRPIILVYLPTNRILVGAMAQKTIDVPDFWKLNALHVYGVFSKSSGRSAGVRPSPGAASSKRQSTLK